MKTWYLYVVFVLSFLLFASKSNPVKDQQKDFEIFKKILLKKEGRLDFSGSSDSVYYRLNQIEKHFQTEQSLLNQFKLYGSVLSKTYCGHTQIHPNKETFREWLSSRNTLPIDYYLIGKRLIVNFLLSEDYVAINEGKSYYQRNKHIPAGSEILSIDNKSVNTMISEMELFLSSDENADDFRYFQASQLFEFYRHVTSPFQKDSIPIEYVIQTGDTLLLYLQPGTAPVHTMNKRLQKSEAEYTKNEANTGEFSITEKIGCFRFKSFRDCHGKSYEDFLKKSFRKLRDKKIHRLIVDLRGNTGGAMQYSIMKYFIGENVYLGRYIVEKPKSGIESFHIKKMHPDYIKHRRMSRTQKFLKRVKRFNNGEMRTEKVDSSLIFNGDIVVITDEGTFSSAAMLACHLKTLKNAKIIGQPAGGSFYNGNAGSLNVSLPNSKFRLFINPNTFYSHLEPVADKLAIKNPDKELSPLIIDQKSRDNYYLNEAKRLFK